MREMKDSGIEWIGDIPKVWKLKRLKALLVERKEKNDPVQTHFILSLGANYGVIPYSQKEGGGNKAKEDVSSYRLAYPGDIVMNSMNIISGSVGLSKYFGCVSPVYYMFYPRNRNSKTEYYHYLFQTKVFQHSLLGLGNGILMKESGNGTFNTVRMRIPVEKLNALMLPFPPLNEQERIVVFLDSECAEIDAVLEKTRASIDEYKKLKQAVITQAVTKGIRGDRPMKDSGESFLHKVPVGWTNSKIKYCAIFSSSCNTSHLTEDSIVTFTPMECIKNGYFENREVVFASTNSSYTQYQEGDIVFAKVTPCFENGNIAIMQGLSSEFGFGSSELFVLRPKSINTKFLFYYLQNDIFKQYACATMTGTGGLKRVSPSFVRNFPIFLPSDSEQADIAEYLDYKCKEIDLLISKKQQYLTEIENYKKSLIYEYVTGKKEVI